MKKIEEYYICDRCKAKIPQEKLNQVSDYIYRYELCDTCNSAFDIYKKECKKLEKQFDSLRMKYKFGEYLPKDNGDKE